MYLELRDKSKSQIKQDLFALTELDFKREGFFVEIGAASGVELSNTYLLEKELGWMGILAEPAKCWHKILKKNRDCIIEKDCVWRDSGSVLEFHETQLPELSTINHFIGSDHHFPHRKNAASYPVKSVSLSDLLGRHNAPKIIDYLSIDTEGSEYEILSNFDFSQYQFRVITCEHNYTPNREKIFNLLTKNGYMRKYTKLSQWDDWYVKIK